MGSYGSGSGQLETIGANAFEGCTSLKNIDINSCYLKIDKEAFKDCTGVQYLRLSLHYGGYSGGGSESRTTTEIGESAFEGCTNLRYADLKQVGSSVIGKRAFADCFKLWKIALPGTQVSTKNWSSWGGILTIESQAFFNTACEGILLPKATNPEDIQIAPDFFDCCDKFKANLKNPLNKYVIYNSDTSFDYLKDQSYTNEDKYIEGNWNSGIVYKPGVYTVPESVKNLPDYITRLSYSAKDELGETSYYINYDYVSNDYTAQDPITLTIESDLPENGTVRIPDFIEEYPHQVTKVLDNSGNAVTEDKITWTHNPMFEFGGSTTTPHLLDGQNVDEPAGGYDFNVDPAPDPNAPTCPVCPPCSTETSDTSEPASSETSEPTSSETSEPTSSETSEPTSSETSEPTSSETSEPVSSNVQTSEPSTSNSEPMSSTPVSRPNEQTGSDQKPNDPNNRPQEGNSNAQKPTESDVSGGNIHTSGNNPDVNSAVNPNTGVRFLAPAIFAGAAIVVVAVRRRKMK